MKTFGKLMCYWAVRTNLTRLAVIFIKRFANTTGSNILSTI